MQNSVYDDLSAAVGFTATLKLRAWFSGGWLYVPKEARAEHPLARLLGMSAFRALVRSFEGDQHLWLPAGCEDRYLRDRDIARRLAAGDSVDEVAARFDLSARRVEQIRAEFVENGILAVAGGVRRRPGRPAVGRSPYRGLALAENLETGGVSQQPPGV
jgi:hypothetical protein